MCHGSVAGSVVFTAVAGVTLLLIAAVVGSTI